MPSSTVGAAGGATSQPAPLNPPTAGPQTVWHPPMALPKDLQVNGYGIYCSALNAQKLLLETCFK